MATSITHDAARPVRPVVWMAAVVASGFVLFGAATVQQRPADLRARGDSRYYLAMVAQQWTLPDRPGWAMSAVPSPLRYRVLVPWIARHLPLDPVHALMAITYVSMVGAYTFILLTCRRLGLSASASIGGLALMFVFLPNLDVYFNPLLTDGFALMMLSVMTYAFVTGSFWLFAACGLIGLFAREVTVVLLPLWCLRDHTRGFAVTAIAALSLTAERLMLPGIGQSFVDAFRATGLLRLHHPADFAKHVRATWMWAFAVVPLGLALLPPQAFAVAAPVSLALLGAAVGTSMLATDVSRMFAVLIPVIAIAAAQLIAALREQRRFTWLAVLLALAALQFCVSLPNNVLGTRAWEHMATAIPTIRLGAIWAVGAAFLLRRDLVRRLRGRDHAR